MPNTGIRLWLYATSFLVFASFGNNEVKAQVANQNSEKLLRGKSLDAWISQAKAAPKLDDRHTALQVLRNDGLQHNRERTLEAFVLGLSDNVPTVRSLSAAGLMKAGLPTHSNAGQSLVDAITKDLWPVKKPKKNTSTKPGLPKDVSAMPIREIRALGIIGKPEQIQLLQKIKQDESLDQLLRKFAVDSIRQIEQRQKREKR